MAKFLYFSGHTQEEENIIDESCFSQWYPATMTENEVTYLTCEHYMMAEKARLFNDDESRKKILACETPKEAKALGRKVQNFDQKTWNNERQQIVFRGNLLKFEQHPDLKEFLLDSDKAIIAEASPWDTIWGIGIDKKTALKGSIMQWKGINLLGVALMKVRQYFWDHDPAVIGTVFAEEETTEEKEETA